MLINLADGDVSQEILAKILAKMDAVSLYRSMMTCKFVNETIMENRRMLSVPLPNHHLMFQISPKPGTYGTRAETSIIQFALEYESWNKDLKRFEKIRLEYCKDRSLLSFMEHRLPEFSIFRYRLFLFRFETESVMLRVLAILRMLNLRCDEIFYPICPSFSLAINTLHPIKIQACCQPNVDWIDCSYNKNFLSYTFERFCIFDSTFELCGLMSDIIEKSLRVELMSCHFRPECYRFIFRLMKKMIEEDHDTLEFWATLAHAPMPTRSDLQALGSYLQTQSENERMIVVVVNERKLICLNIMRHINGAINLILRRYSSLEAYKEYYCLISLDPGRFVFSRMIERINQNMNKIKFH